MKIDKCPDRMEWVNTLVWTASMLTRLKGNENVEDIPWELSGHIKADWDFV